MQRSLFLFLAAAVWAAGCGSEAPKPASQAETKPAEPAVPQEMTDAAHALLGSDAQVLLFGDLAQTGKQQFVAANVVPNTPKSKIAGTVVTRAVVAENDDGKWVEILRVDEYLKNSKGFLGLTPLQAVTGWKFQQEQSELKGLTLYFTPIKADTNERTLPIAVKWDPSVKRYRSLDLHYENFLTEAASLESPRSMLR
jgi:hypothetical protein